MNIQEVANKLVEHCRVGAYDKAYELYDENAKSIEPHPGMGPMEVQGLAGIRQKGAAWESMVEEIHSGTISDPIIAGGHFAITMKNDVTFKEGGRKTIEEVCVYEVQNGKIVKEQFFYPGQ